MRKLFVSLESSFIPQRKLNGFAVAAPIIGDVLSAWSSLVTNDTNRRIARDVNKSNQEINASQLAAARKQFEDELAETRRQRAENFDWNSEFSQVQRWKEAGINPYLAMTEGAAGSMSADNPSVPKGDIPSSLPMQTGAPMVAPDLGSGLSRAVMDYYQSLKVESDIQRQNVQNANDIAQTIEAIHQMKIEGRYKEQLTNDLVRQYNENMETWHERKLLPKLNNDKLIAEAEKFNTESNSIRIHDNIDSALAESNLRVNQAQISELYASVNKLNKEGALVDEQRRQEILNGTVDRWAKRIGIHKDKEEYRQFKKRFVYETKNLEFYDSDGWRWKFGLFGNGAQPVGVISNTKKMVQPKPKKVIGFRPK